MSVTIGVFEAISGRRSIRRYQDRPVEQEKILKLLESARLAPSGSNTQPWHFIIVKDPETRCCIARVDHDQSWMLGAPVFIVCVGDTCCRREIPSIQEDTSDEEVKQIIRDTSVAIGHILLTAFEMGLGSCWTAWFRQKEIRPILDIPESKYVCGVITLGYPAETPEPRPRRALESMLHYEKW